MRYLFLLVCLMGAHLAHANDTDIEFSPEYKEMQSAVAKAQLHLDRAFRAAHLGDGKFHPAFLVKVGFPTATDDADREIIWIENISLISNGQFSGELANEPLNLGDWRYGDVVHFTRDQIQDWSLFITDGQSYGHFTTHVILKHLSETQAQAIRDRIGDQPVPTAWQ